jgi:hypothetical protein
VTFADTVPLVTDSPEPTTTAPAVVVVAAGNLAADTVPLVSRLASVVGGEAATTAVVKSEIVDAVCVPVCVDRSRSWASVEFAVAPEAMPSSFVFAADADHHAAMAWTIRCAVHARRVVDVPASASNWSTVSADHSRESDSLESEDATAPETSETPSVIEPVRPATLWTGDAAAALAVVWYRLTDPSATLSVEPGEGLIST